ncbi:hypothetical protein [Dactylosporangium sp. NPDC051484]|uniref:hypothetical protein n=1 Tax=Dactylosporangium sp. NPDC051484 TaxID=3154942 RepID=UPI00344F46F3
MTAQLSARYTKLLRWYPAGYRAERGPEIVGTYLELAAAGQRWPRPGDVVDLLTGGLRQHLRARNAGSLTDALPITGTLAVTAATVLAALWTTFMFGVSDRYGPNAFANWNPDAGPVNILNAGTWLIWLLVPLAALAGYARWALGVAIALTTALLLPSALVPATEVTSDLVSPMFVLLPQIALGLVALAAPARRGLRGTAAITGTAGAAAAMALLAGPQGETLTRAGFLLALAAIGLGVLLTRRHDRRAWWPAVLMLGPVLMLLTRLLEGPSAGRRYTVAWMLMSLLVAGVVLVTAVQRQAKQRLLQAD